MNLECGLLHIIQLDKFCSHEKIQYLTKRESSCFFSIVEYYNTYSIIIVIIILRYESSVLPK